MMANYWASRGWAEVTLITLSGPGETPFFRLHPAVRYRPLGVEAESLAPVRAVANNLGRVGRLRAAIVASQPLAVISFLDRANVLTLLAAAGLGLPVVVAERIDPRHRVLGHSWRAMRQLTYPAASRVVAQTESALAYFPPWIQRRGLVIPNPVQPPPGFTAAPDAPPPVVMAMGRLERQKGFDLLIDAFARVAPAHPEWRLEIWGQGPLRERLEAQAADLGLGDRVRLPGVTRRPGAAMEGAGLFVLSSRYEGFPNALCEAMACGLPAISFDCPSGPREIIRDGEDGVLVPAGDVAGLAAAMGRLMGDGAERARLAARAPDVNNRFGMTKVMGIWEALLEELAPFAYSSSSARSTTGGPSAS
jgi:glycosyltransferase involved in cell wall biosynthesis